MSTTGGYQHTDLDTCSLGGFGKLQIEVVIDLVLVFKSTSLSSGRA
jgi:hypothetical protein